MRLFDPNAELYIWIVRWEDFQHYRPDPARGPAWIKAYTAQLDDERYLSLSDRQRALLWDLRMMFAAMRGRVPHGSPTNVRRTFDERSTTVRRTSGNALTITRRRQSQTRHDDLDALNHAGFIEFVSREGLEDRLEEFYSRSRVARTRAGAGARSQEEEKEEENPPSPPSGGARPIGRKDLRRYTGCQARRGTHGSGWKHTPLGTDKPPPDWPHDKPTEHAIRVALARQWIDTEDHAHDDDTIRAVLTDRYGLNGDQELELLDYAADRRRGTSAA